MGDPVKSVIKAFDILEELVKNNSPMTLSSISKSLSINISTVHRLINTMVKLGYVSQNNKGLYKTKTFTRKDNVRTAYCTAVGKALLANLEEGQLKDYIKNTRLKRYTNNTITDPTKLLNELQIIRKQGYALAIEENEIGVCSVAAPLFDTNNKLLGAVSVSGPCSRITEKYLMTSLIPLVRVTAKRITSRLQ